MGTGGAGSSIATRASGRIMRWGVTVSLGIARRLNPFCLFGLAVGTNYRSVGILKRSYCFKFRITGGAKVLINWHRFPEILK